ncbi:MAG: glutathione peroxidase [Lentimicrobiaceae bacterium]|nr:glutathione peroxidase [Lentimicrobiaceae bacterium]
MKKTLFIPLLMLAFALSGNAQKTLYDFTVTTIDGNPVNLSKYKGKKVLIVNTASKCGLTPQYKELEALYQKYKDQNFVILGFPSNDFMNQEPGTDEEIKEFCEANYGVTFPMMSKISVKGDTQNPLYVWLTHKSQNGVLNADVSWNFQKFMVDENGYLVDYTNPRESPFTKKIVDWIEN